MEEYSNIPPTTDTILLQNEIDRMGAEINSIKNGTSALPLQSNYFENKYPYLSKNYPKMFKLVMVDNLEDKQIIKMLIARIAKIQSGDLTRKQADVQTGVDFAQKFIYPKIDMRKENAL